MTPGRAPEVVVVGGGIVGCATAAFLAADGVRVTLIEANEIAFGASGRNSGVVQQPFDPALVGLYRRSVELYRELQAAMPESFRLDPEPSGLLLVGPESASDEAARLVAAWHDAYPETQPELVAGAALRSLEPELAEGLVACRLRIGYPVAPASATRAYAALAERLGAQIELAGVGLATKDDQVTGVWDGHRVLEADCVVIAAGPWSSWVVGGDFTWPPVYDSWGVVASIALDHSPRHVLEEMDINIEPGDGDDDEPSPDSGFGFSLVSADGASALGSTFLARRPEEADVLGRLQERGARYVPAIATAPVVGTRTCARPVTLDGRPMIGPVPGFRGAYVAAGHGPWGISTGPGSARLIADMVLGRESVIPEALGSARFGAPWR